MSIACIYYLRLLRKTPTSFGQSAGSVSSGTYKRSDKSDAIKTLKIRLDLLEGSVSRNQRRIQRRHGAGHKDFKYLNTMDVTSIANPDVITKLDFSDAKKRENKFWADFPFPLFSNKTIRKTSALLEMALLYIKYFSY